MKRGAEIMLVFVCLMLGMSLGLTFQAFGTIFQTAIEWPVKSSENANTLDSGPTLDAGE
tara:strand:- start:3497 stop:3673 length:177 start_codon:yes stop_codon:yes gene_type:complete